jgi:hypothetical protein
MFYTLGSMSYCRNRILVKGLTVLFVSMTSLTLVQPQGAIAREERPSEISVSVAPTETIVIGRSPQHHYVVIIPVHNMSALVTDSPAFKLLQTVRTIAPQAFLSRHGLGDYIYMSGFDRLGPAQQQLRQISPYAANARVVYFP